MEVDYCEDHAEVNGCEDTGVLTRDGGGGVIEVRVEGHGDGWMFWCVCVCVYVCVLDLEGIERWSKEFDRGRKEDGTLACYISRFFHGCSSRDSE